PGLSGQARRRGAVVRGGAVGRLQTDRAWPQRSRRDVRSRRRNWPGALIRVMMIVHAPQRTGRIAMPGLLTSRLPPLFLREDMRELLSCDGMVYGRCPECSWEHLVDIVSTMPVDSYHEALTHACQRCGYTGGLTLARHDMRIEARCLDCGHVAEQLVGLDRE